MRSSDRFARRLRFASLAPEELPGLVDRALDPGAFAARAHALLDRFRVRPEWGEAEFLWLFEQARRKSSSGTLHAREVLDRTGRLIGLYLLYARSGAIAEVLQVLSERNRESVVLSALIRHAATIGAVAIRGRASSAVVRGLTRQSGIVYRNGGAAVAFARDPELRDALRSDEAFLGGLMGESWTRLVADDFA